MVGNTYMTGALLLHYDKKFIFHFKNETSAVIELKIWKVTESSKYPSGIKYSLFCMEKSSGSIIVGIDNHYPKSHHLHILIMVNNHIFSNQLKI